ncbi:hypothetical protein TG4357_03095 [Thalassovita gelatinovora]|uniref:Uncharacterized protein n=1 Tax=Thalassovita gelatinovora TaxID=53501 RepID=A0A0P1FI20_THAGE|nr:hypothetical protein TG4357_03095 [Thalassovita gelatinovora]SEP71231.1 hypothetical protein SAMN04488043_101165 [Thalassovita gelatinovora]
MLQPRSTQHFFTFSLGFSLKLEKKHLKIRKNQDYASCSCSIFTLLAERFAPLQLRLRLSRPRPRPMISRMISDVPA